MIKKIFSWVILALAYLGIAWVLPCFSEMTKSALLNVAIFHGMAIVVISFIFLIRWALDTILG